MWSNKRPSLVTAANMTLDAKPPGQGRLEHAWHHGSQAKLLILETIERCQWIRSLTLHVKHHFAAVGHARGGVFFANKVRRPRCINRRVSAQKLFTDE